MAYIPRTTMSDRSRFMATGAGGGAASGGMPIASPPPTPQSPAGGQFAGLRAFFSANQPNVEGLASDLAAGLGTKAQDAVGKAARSAETYESAGGAGLAADALAARDDARRDLDALGSQAGIAAMLEQRQPGVGYTAGMKNADAAMLGRSDSIGEARDRWAGTLGGLDPTYRPGAPTPPAPEPFEYSNKPNMDKPGGDPADGIYPNRRRKTGKEVY
jgi:hypothetical protein